MVIPTCKFLDVALTDQFKLIDMIIFVKINLMRCFKMTCVR